MPTTVHVTRRSVNTEDNLAYTWTTCYEINRARLALFGYEHQAYTSVYHKQESDPVTKIVSLVS